MSPISFSAQSLFCGLVLMASMASFPCEAQGPSEKEIDEGMLSQDVISIGCDFRRLVDANDCVRRILPTLSYRSRHFVASQVTFLLKVTYKEFPDPNNGGQPMLSVGSAFLIDRDKGYFLTAKHVLMGKKVWSTYFPKEHLFADLETAIEDYLYQPKNVDIRLQSVDGGASVSADLIALDRTSDLALLSVKGIEDIAVQRYPALFQALTPNSTSECKGSIKVYAIGYTDSLEPGKYQSSATQFARARCGSYPKTYDIGGQKYRIALSSTDAPFRPGFSGGPVLNGDFQLVGVVSGATLGIGGAGSSFFVPVSVVRSFLGRFE